MERLNVLPWQKSKQRDQGVEIYLLNFQFFPKWFPSRFLKISALLHIVLFIFILLVPEFWGLYTGIFLANHLIIMGACLRPRSGLLGPNLCRLSPRQEKNGEIALSFDDGPDPEVTPKRAVSPGWVGSWDLDLQEVEDGLFDGSKTQYLHSFISKLVNDAEDNQAPTLGNVSILIEN